MRYEIPKANLHDNQGRGTVRHHHTKLLLGRVPLLKIGLDDTFHDDGGLAGRSEWGKADWDDVAKKWDCMHREDWREKPRERSWRGRRLALGGGKSIACISISAR